MRLAEGLYVLRGAVNTGALVVDGAALLFDCCETITDQRLAELGAERVEQILCTQHRRPNVAGAYRYVAHGAELVVSRGERHLFEEVGAYWSNPCNRWHIYHHQPQQVLARPLAVSRGVAQGDVIEWHGRRITVLDTPGATDGSVSYLIDTEAGRVAFCGDALYSPGQLWDLYSLQKGDGGDGPVAIRDYHGFLGNKRLLLPSLRALGRAADRLVPAHGEVLDDPVTAIELVCQRLDHIWRNYTAISALNHYFPHFFDDTRDDPLRMTPAPTFAPPSFFRRVAATSFALVSDTGAVLLIDCGAPVVVDTLRAWQRAREIGEVEACWITHYHDDHVDALPALQDALGCPIWTEEHVAEVVEHPRSFFLPCISPHGAPVARALRDGESWAWHEFTLTAHHFPGQTYYHSGLLVEGHGLRLYVAGDSGAPTGLDDHCCPNRIFLGSGPDGSRGFRRCLQIWRETRPDLIFNAHQDRAFRFSDEQLDTMDALLARREQLFAELLPWPHPDFGTDENWVRAYPYEQDVAPGQAFCLAVHMTNHDTIPTRAMVEPVLPDGWHWDRERSMPSVVVPAKSAGCVAAHCSPPDGAATLWCVPPVEAAPGQYVIPLRVWWGEHYLGQIRHALAILVT
jgi:glyoxylase-like metal-dependent hydrolase (beta-lactamase superfamily II)